MSLTQDYLPFGGGLDEVSPLTDPAGPGRLLACDNFEILLGRRGYSRARGCEAYDGRAQPHLASYSLVWFELGDTEITVGSTITLPAGTAVVLRVTLSSGSWVGADAVGQLAVTAITGDIAAADTIDGGPAVVTSVRRGNFAGPNHAADIAAAREHYRAPIAQVPGQGPVRGIATFSSFVLALRDDVGGAAATLWRASAAGWVSVRAGLRPGGALRSTAENFTGLASRRALYAVDGKNRQWSWDGTTFAFADAIYGSEATSATSLTPGAGPKVFTVAEASRSWQPGDELIAYSAANAGSFMVGTVASYSHPTLTLTVTSFGGATAADWHVCRNDGQDRAFEIATHQMRLWWAYPLGQLQSSALGDPMRINGTAALIGAGGEIVGLKPVRGELLAVMTTDKVRLLYGSSPADWVIKPHSSFNGLRRDMTVETGGNAIFATDQGLMTLSGTQAFGDFNAAAVSTKAAKLAKSVIGLGVCSVLSRENNQLRVYASDGRVMLMSWPAAEVSARTTEFMSLRRPHAPVCAEVASIDGEEAIYFGTADGWIMRDAVGSTHNGELIDAYFRTAYWHAKMPQRKKRQRKLTINATASEPVRVRIRQNMDFGGQAAGLTHERDALPPGGFWGEADWGEFYLSTPEASELDVHVEGAGRFIGYTVQVKDAADAIRIEGLHTLFSTLGLQR